MLWGLRLQCRIWGLIQTNLGSACEEKKILGLFLTIKSKKLYFK